MLRAGTAAVRAGRSVINLSDRPLAEAMVMPMDTSSLVDEHGQGLHILISVYVTQGRVAVPGGQAEERARVEIPVRSVAEVNGLQKSGNKRELCGDCAMSCLLLSLHTHALRQHGFSPPGPCMAVCSTDRTVPTKVHLSASSGPSLP
jgi:hypothetical protein